jgi:ankyrin repeat protein
MEDGETRNAILDEIVKLAGNKTDYQGEGILHYAARIADAKTVQKLLEKGLDRTVRNISGETPHDIAVRWQRKDIIDLL